MFIVGEVEGNDLIEHVWRIISVAHVSYGELQISDEDSNGAHLEDEVQL